MVMVLGGSGTANGITSFSSSATFLSSLSIGNTSPTYKLDITDNTTGQQLRLSSSHINGTSMAFDSSSTNGRVWRIGSNYVDGVGEFAVYDATSGLRRLNVDSSGRVNIPYQPSFSAGLSTNWSASSGTSTIPFAAATHNVGSCYNTSTYRFTAPVAGKYIFNCNLGTTNNTSTIAYFGILIYKNGNAFLNGWQSKALTSNSYVCDSKSLIMDLAINDYVEFKLETQAAVTVGTGVVTGQLLG
jgi:hypothetical protein